MILEETTSNKRSADQEAVPAEHRKKQKSEPCSPVLSGYAVVPGSPALPLTPRDAFAEGVTAPSSPALPTEEAGMDTSEDNDSVGTKSPGKRKWRVKMSEEEKQARKLARKLAKEEARKNDPTGEKENQADLSVIDSQVKRGKLIDLLYRERLRPRGRPVGVDDASYDNYPIPIIRAGLALVRQKNDEGLYEGQNVDNFLPDLEGLFYDAYEEMPVESLNSYSKEDSQRMRQLFHYRAVVLRSLNLKKTYVCPHRGCTAAYQQWDGLKYHLTNQNSRHNTPPHTPKLQLHQQQSQPQIA
eukprot:Colp12_sorted_trinity150504_noHs@10298